MNAISIPIWVLVFALYWIWSGPGFAAQIAKSGPADIHPSECTAQALFPSGADSSWKDEKALQGYNASSGGLDSTRDAPEPSTLILFGTGLIAMLVIARKRLLRRT